MAIVLRIVNESVRPTKGRRADFPTPFIVGDIRPYASPIDGKMITSRSQRREDLKANGCVEWDAGMSKRDKGYSNPDFALKRGLPLNEKGMDKLNERKKHDRT